MSSSDATVRVEKLVAGGEGLGRLDDGRILFLAGVAPGDVVEVAFTDERRDYVRGSVLRLVEFGADRVEPECGAVRAGCGGCDWQHLAPASQARTKIEIVAEAFRRTARLTIEPVLGESLPPEARRTTVRAAADEDGRLGFRRASSSEVVVHGSCLVSHPVISSALASMRLDGEGEVTIRVGEHTGECAYRVTGARLVDGAPPGARSGPTSRITEIVRGHRFTVSIGSFFQSSPHAADLLVGAVTGALDVLGVEGGRLVDLYGGVGLFARCLADRFDSVTVVDGSVDACRDAVRNLQDCAATIDCSDVDAWAPVDAEVVIADPARIGLGKRGVAAVNETGARDVILVSCDATSAARDARLLVDAGYAPVSVRVLDLFPHTHHVEVVAAYRRAEDRPLGTRPRATPATRSSTARFA